MDSSNANSPQIALRVLLVEDNADDAILIRRSLERGGFMPELRVVDDAETFRAALDDPPDLVISDFHQPDFDALRALELLQQRGLEIPFIVVSGSLDDATAAETLRRGAADYLLKDRLARLPSAVQGVLVRQRLKSDKQAAEDALERNERRYRALIEHGGSAVSLVSRDGLNLYVSPAMLELTGFGSDERTARSCFDLIHPGQASEVRGALSRAAASPGESASVEFQLRRKDGSWRWVSALYTNLLQDPDVGAIVVNARDITGRVEREQALRESEERLRNVIDASADGYWEWQLDTGTMLWSERFCRMLGLAPEECTASLQTFYNLLHEDDLPRAQRCIESLLHGTGAYDNAFRMRTADGEYRVMNLRGKLILNAAGEPDRIVGMISDTTGQQASIARIHRLNAFYSALAGVSDAIVRAHDETKLFREVCRIAVESGGLMLAWIGCIDESTGKVFPVAAHGEAAADLEKVELSIDASRPSGRGPTGIALREGRVYVCNDWWADAGAAWWHDKFGHAGVGSMAVVPLRVDGKVFGGLMVYATEKNFFDEELVRLHEQLANSVGFAVQAIERERLRRMAEAELRASEARFRSLTELSSDWYWEQDADGRFTYISEGFYAALGLCPGDVIGKTRWEIWPQGTDAGKWQAHRALVEAHLPFTDLVYRAASGDGRSLMAATSGRPVHDEHGVFRGYRGIGRDITRRWENDQELCRLAVIFESSGEAITGFTLDRICTAWNPASEQLYGIPAGDIVGRDFSVIVPPEYRRQLQQSLDRIAQGEKVEVPETQRIRGNGTRIDLAISYAPIVDGAGRVTGATAMARDITARKAAERALRDSEEKFRQLADSIPEVFWISTPDLSRYYYISPAYESVFGLSRSAVEADAETWWDAVLPEDTEQLRRSVPADPGQGFDVEYRIRRPDGSVRWLHEQAFPVRNDQGEIHRLAGLTVDITEKKRLEERLLQLAHYDSLTGLPNRVLLHDRLRQALAQARRNSQALAVLLLDIDRFKLVNDSFGHAAGDDLVRQMGRRLADCARAGDTVARLGGDEFAVVLNELASGQDAEKICEKILQVFSEPFEIEERDVFVTPSIGVTVCPDDGDSEEDLLRNADTAMYRAKELGGNSYQYFRSDLNRRSGERVRMETDLRRALGRGEFVLHYQPRIRASNNEVTVVEALIRWNHPQRGMVQPGAFIPLLEETGMIIDVGEWVLHTACADAQRWRTRGTEAVVAVNISARQFQSGTLESVVRRTLESTGLPGACLELELTESYLMQDAARAVETLRSLKGLGVRLAVDDFGTGYSNMAYLKQFPLNVLKIDRSFVRDIATDPDDAQIVRAIIDMAHGLRLEVIAEGVETAAQYDFLAAHGCDELQGFLIARPMAPDSLDEFLSRQAIAHLPACRDSAARTVLALDDEPDILELLAHSLGKDGYKVLTTTDAAQALELLATHDVGVVLSDERMPGISGVEFLRQVKELHPGSIRILASAHANPDRLVEAINRAGIFKFVGKPWSRETLHAAVREAFWFRQQAETHRKRGARSPGLGKRVA
ncbi:MAG: PAS domain S-box protein [Burkholderiales bacterium]